MKIILILLISLFTYGCKSKDVIYEDKTNDFINIENSTFEVYSDIYLNDVIKVANDDVKLISENYKINTEKLGVQDLSVYYEYDGKKFIYNLKIKIKDTISPLVFSGTNKTLLINYDEDLCDVITYGDNYTKDVNCKIEGTYDLSKVGTYNLIYILTDESGNEKKVNVTLNIVESLPKSSNNKTKINFSDIYKKHKNDNTEIGIDISKWQGEIDFNKVKNAGATFVIMRIARQNEQKGELVIDEYYAQNIKKAKEAGLKVGVYLYSIATSIDEAINQANYVIKTLSGEKLDLPIVFDWESWSSWNSFKISFYDINSIADEFIKAVENKGYNGMLYSSKFYLETIWTNKENNPVWLAHYTDETNYEGDYQFWQLCNNGKIDGISSDVDIDIMYKK